MARKSATDLANDVANKTNHQAAINPDGTLTVSKNGVVHFSKVVFIPNGEAITDANPSGDTVLIYSADGSEAKSDAQLFLNSLK